MVITVDKMDNGRYVANVRCIKCKKFVRIDVPDEEKLDQLNRVLDGEANMRTISSWMSANDREMFISGFCEECWNDIFKS